jgi:predicted dehydrogenase
LQINRTRVAVIGTGGIGKGVHIPAYVSNRDVHLVALVDADLKKAKRIARRFHVKKVFSSADDLFEREEIDAVSVCTPPNSHASVALSAFDHGVDVLCEKPLAVNVDDGRAIVRACQAKGRTLMVGFHRRFFPNYQRAKECVQRGDLGHVYCVEDHYLEPNPLFGWTKSEWFFSPGVGGVLLDLAPHVFDMLNYIFDSYPIGVAAYASAFLDSPVEDTCTFFAEYSKGRVGIGIVSWLSSTVTGNTNILGTGQDLSVSPTFFFRSNPVRVREVALLRAASESLLSMKLPNSALLSTRRANPYQREIDFFVESVRGGRRSLSNALNALSVLIACDAARTAIEKKCTIRVPSPED